MTMKEVPRGVEPGATMTTAMLSPVLGGLIRTWTHDGPALWSVDDPDRLSEIIGRGLIARTPVPDDRFREAAYLNADAGTLIVQSRYAAGGEQSAQTEATIFQLGQADRPEEGSVDGANGLPQFGGAVGGGSR